MDRVSGSFGSSGLIHPLPGREREQRQLAELLELALRRYGGVVLISGEAGIGKTTLSDWLSDLARQSGAGTLTGHCYSMTSGHPYMPWAEIQKSAAEIGHTHSLPALSQLSGLPSGPGSKTELFEQVSSALRELASSAPLVLTIEDIHWADSASLELLRHIARQTANLPLLLVATYRDDDPDQTDVLAGILPDLVRESRARRIELRSLTLNDVEAFLDWTGQPARTTSPELAKYLHQRADGNPFFMTELLRDLDDDRALSQNPEALPVPSLVRQVIDNRVQRLAKETRRLLNVAAVIGQDVPVDLWQEIAESSDTVLLRAVEEAVSGHLLRESRDGASVRFVHGLIQETLYQGQLALRRRLLHQQIAEHLETRTDHSSGTIAHHFERAGDARAIDWLVRAAGEAQEIYAAQDAVRYIKRAEELAYQHSISVPHEAYRTRALAREMMGEIETARADYSRLLHATREAGDQAAECRALIDLGLHWSGQDYQQCGAYLQQALSIAGQLEDRRLHAHCLNRVGNWQANTGRLESAIALHHEALQIFETTGDPDGIADTLDLLGSTSFLAGSYAASVGYFDRAIERSRELNNRVRLASSLSNQGLNGGDSDVSFDAGMAASRTSETWVSYGEEAVEIACEIGWKSGEAFARAMLASTVTVRGNLGRGLELLEQAHDIAHRFGHQQWLTATSVIMGSLWLELLDPSRAEMHFQRGRALAAGIGSHLWSVVLDSSLAALHAENGDLQSALKLIEPWMSDQPLGRSHDQRVLWFAAARIRLAAGEPAQTLEIASHLLALEEGASEVGGIPQILKLKAEALGMLDRIEEADDTYRQASRAAEVLGYVSVQWRILRNWSVIATRRRQGQQAGELRARAERIVHELAGTISDPEIRGNFQSRAHELIRAAGQTGPRVANPAGLSRRELEVLSLVARGLTDAQVGEQLFISPRTVARHLQSIYAKLGVNSRTSATAFAWEQQIIS